MPRSFRDSGEKPAVSVRRESPPKVSRAERACARALAVQRNYPMASGMSATPKSFWSLHIVVMSLQAGSIGEVMPLENGTLTRRCASKLKPGNAIPGPGFHLFQECPGADA